MSRVNEKVGSTALRKRTNTVTVEISVADRMARWKFLFVTEQFFFYPTNFFHHDEQEKESAD